MGLFSFFKKKAPKQEAPVAETPVVNAPAEEKPAAPAAPAPEKPAAPAAPAPEKPAAPVAPAPEKPAAPVAPAPEKPAAPAAPAPEKPAAPAAPAVTVKPAPAVVVKAAPAPAPTPAPAPAEAPAEEEKREVMGKVEFDLAPDGYRFYLIANNGQLLYESIGYTTLEGAKVALDTFVRAVEKGAFAVLADKFGRYRYVLNRKYFGENYSSKAGCERSVESVKYFALHSTVSDYEPTEEQLAAYAEAKAQKRTVADVDWDAVAAAEAAAAPLGKFEIVRGEDREFRFYLVANNGQILYSGKNFPKLCLCQKGIESFKRAVYVGNFSVDCDKFGRYRYILKNVGVAPAFMGESYTSKEQCQSSIESVKRFVVSAKVVLPESPAEEE